VNRLPPLTTSPGSSLTTMLPSAYLRAVPIRRAALHTRKLVSSARGPIGLSSSITAVYHRDVDRVKHQPSGRLHPSYRFDGPAFRRRRQRVQTEDARHGRRFRARSPGARVATDASGWRSTFRRSIARLVPAARTKHVKPGRSYVEATKAESEGRRAASSSRRARISANRSKRACHSALSTMSRFECGSC
jgi:hypothetical protein